MTKKLEVIIVSRFDGWSVEQLIEKLENPLIYYEIQNNYKKLQEYMKQREISVKDLIY